MSQTTKQMTDDEWADEIGTQIVEVSHIALTKHKLLIRAAWLSLLAFVFWVASFASLAFT